MLPNIPIVKYLNLSDKALEKINPIVDHFYVINTSLMDSNLENDIELKEIDLELQLNELNPSLQ